jgi:hypothetical protein
MAENDGSKSVMGNLPSTRPARIGGRRDTRGAAAEKPKPAVAKPKPAAARPKAKQPAASKPRAVRSGSPALKTKPAREARKPEPATPPSGTEFVTTAVQAAGELAQIGLTLGGQVVKRAVRRLPKR